MVNAGDILGAHRILSLLGSGGMGNVWVAEHLLIGRRVAIKVLRPDLSEREDVVERFFDEARAAAQIADPGIVAVHDFGRHAESAYIVMELLVGETLSARLARISRLPPVVAARLAMHVAMTMAVTHGHGIVHRDLKPENLFLVSDAAVAGGERLKILDFGIAKLLAEHDAASRTQTGAILGTPMYMSPEQCRNAGGVDHRTDVYALGCVLFHMLCGVPPFRGSSSGDLIAAHLVDTAPSPSSLVPSVSPALDAIVARCLCKASDERFASMSELARALAPCANVAIDIATIVPLGTGHGRRSAPATPASPTPEIGLLTTLATGAGEASDGPTRRPRRARSFAIAGAIVAAIVGIAAIRHSSEPHDDGSPLPLEPAGAPRSATTATPTTPSALPATTAPATTAPATTATTAPATTTKATPTRSSAGSRHPRPQRSVRPIKPSHSSPPAATTTDANPRDEGAYELDE